MRNAKVLWLGTATATSTPNTDCLTLALMPVENFELKLTDEGGVSVHRIFNMSVCPSCNINPFSGVWSEMVPQLS